MKQKIVVIGLDGGFLSMKYKMYDFIRVSTINIKRIADWYENLMVIVMTKSQYIYKGREIEQLC